MGRLTETGHPPGEMCERPISTGIAPKQTKSPARRDHFARLRASRLLMLRMFVVRCRTSWAYLRIGSRRAIASICPEAAVGSHRGPGHAGADDS